MTNGQNHFALLAAWNKLLPEQKSFLALSDAFEDFLVQHFPELSYAMYRIHPASGDVIPGVMGGDLSEIDQHLFASILKQHASIDDIVCLKRNSSGPFSILFAKNKTREAAVVFPIFIRGEKYGYMLFLSDQPAFAHTTEVQHFLQMLAFSFASALCLFLESEEVAEIQRMMQLQKDALFLSSNGIVISDARQPDNPILFVNRAFEKITGYSAEEVIGKNCRFLQGPEQQQPGLQIIRNSVKEAKEGGAILRNYRKDGTLFYNELHITPLFNSDGELTHYVGVQIDVTERIDFEAHLKHFSHRLSVLLQNLQDGILVEDEHRRIVLANQEFCNIFLIPFPPDGLIGYDCNGLADQSKSFFIDEQGFLERVDKLLLNKKSVKNDILETKDGRIIERDYVPIFIDENYSGHLWRYRDVTYKKNSERELIESEARYRSLIQEAKDIIFRISTEGKFLYVNPVAIHVVHFREEELVGKHFTSLVRKDYQETVTLFYRKQVEESIAETYLEFPIITGLGEEVWIGQKVTPVYSGGAVQELQGVARDITDTKKMEFEVERLKSFYEHILDDLPGQIAVFDKDFKYLYINPASLSRKEFREWIIGKDDYEYCRYRGLDERLAILRQARLRQAVQEKQIISFEERMQKPEGDVKYFYRYVSPVLDQNKEVVYLIGYGIDITEQRIAEEERNRFFSLSIDLVCIATPEGYFKRVNPAFERLLGYSSIELMSTSFINFVHPDDRQSTIMTMSMLKTGKSVNDFQNRYRDKFGAYHWLSWSAYYYADGDVIYATARDITERKQFEHELISAKELAEASTKAKEQFLAHMSHEIRTPMNAVVGLTHLLLQMSPTIEQEEFLRVIKNSSDNLLVIINDILDFSKIQAGKMEFFPEPIEIKELLQQALHTVRYAADEKNLILHLTVHEHVPPVIVVDPTRLQQVILNLLSNAIKFTDAGMVSMEVAGEPKDSDTFIFQCTIKDSGIGIPEEQLELIFQSFEQVKQSNTRKIKGTGLGLAIVKRLIEEQGGMIAVRSKPELGSEFSFRLPVKIAVTEAVRSSENIPFDLSRVRLDSVHVLIVEDNKMNQLVASNILKVWGATYEIADNGRLGFEAAKNGSFDLILMDLNMPEMNGYDSAAMIRTQLSEPKNKVPILALTASAMLEVTTRLKEAGIDDFISKPFKPADLLAKIVSYVPKLLKISSSSEQTTENSEVTVLSPESPADNISLEFLDTFSDGSDDFMIDFLESFNVHIPKQIAQLYEAVREKRWSEVRKLAHKTKPSFSYVGLDRIKILLEDIEMRAEDSSKQWMILEMLMEIDTVSRKACTQVEAEINRIRKKR